jgi:hypothetical protein
MLFCTQNSWSQQELNLHFLKNVWQSNQTNPSFGSPPLGGGGALKRFVVQLPSAFTSIESDYSINDLAPSGVIRLDSNLINRLDANNNRISSHQSFQTIGAAFRFKKNWVFSISQTSKSDFSLNFSKDLLKLAIFGNRPYVGQTLALEGQLNSKIYSEWAFGAAFERENWRFGGRVKVLFGISAIQMPNYKSKLLTDPLDYNLNLQNDLQLQTAGNYALQIASPASLPSKGLFSGNVGASLDIGASFKHEKWQFAVSAIDLGGSIKWADAKTYVSQGNFVYRPAQSENLFQLNNFNALRLRDSLERIFGIKTITGDKFSSKIPLKIYASATYKVNEKWNVGGLVYHENRPENSQNVVSLSAQYQVLPILMVGTSFSNRNQQFTNVGLQSVLTYKMFQLYLTTDNIIQIIDLNSAKSTNGRVGLNLLF